MDYAYNISPSTETGRLAATFADRDFLIILASQMLNRVGSRRDALNVATHLVFPPEIESDVRTWIDAKAEWLIAAPARQAATEAAQMAYEERQAEMWKAAAEKAAKKQAKRLAAGEAVEVSWRDEPWEHRLRMPYGKGAPLLLRGAGAKWDAVLRAWVFPKSAMTAVMEVLPECRALVVDQRARDARKAKAKAKARAEEAMGVGSRWNMTDDEIISELGYMPRSESAMEDAFGTSDY